MKKGHPIVLELTGFVVTPDQDAARKALHKELDKVFGPVELKFNGGPGVRPSVKSSDVSIYDVHRFTGCIRRALGNTCPVTFTVTM